MHDAIERYNQRIAQARDNTWLRISYWWRGSMMTDRDVWIVDEWRDNAWETRVVDISGGVVDVVDP